jgi:hypothetical protein
MFDLKLIEDKRLSMSQADSNLAESAEYFQ